MFYVFKEEILHNIATMSLLSLIEHNGRIHANAQQPQHNLYHNWAPTVLTSIFTFVAIVC